MSYSSDVQAKRVTGTGSLAVGPARIRQIHVLSGSGTPRLTITDGNGGATVLDLDLVASDMPTMFLTAATPGWAGSASLNQKKANSLPLPISKKKCWP